MTAAVPKSIVDLVARIAPELMMAPLAEGTKGEVSFKNLDGAKLDALVKKISVVAVGARAVDRGGCSGVCAADGGEDDGAGGDRCGCVEWRLREIRSC